MTFVPSALDRKPCFSVSLTQSYIACGIFLPHVAVSLRYSGGIFNSDAFHLLLSLFA